MAQEQNKVKGRDGAKWSRRDGREIEDIFREFAKENHLKCDGVDFLDYEEISVEKDRRYLGPNGQKIKAYELFVFYFIVEVHVTKGFFIAHGEWESENDEYFDVISPDAWADDENYVEEGLYYD